MIDYIFDKMPNWVSYTLVLLIAAASVYYFIQAIIAYNPKSYTVEAVK